MSDISDSTYPESTAGPTSPIFGTASFSTFTTTALTSLWPPSSRRTSGSGSSCGSENHQSESGTYQDDQSVAETEEGGVALVADDGSNVYEDDESEVSVERNSQLSTSDTLSSSYHIQTTSGEYTRTPTRNSSQSYEEASTPVYTDPYLASSSEHLADTLSRTTLTPTYSGTTPHSHSRSYTTSSHVDRSGQDQPLPRKRTAGQLIAFYEQQAHTRAASAPTDTGHSRPGSPAKPTSHSNSAPVGMPGALPHGRSDGASWRTSGSGKTLSSWSFGSERSRSPVKTTSESDSAVSGSVPSRSSGYTRSGSTRSGYGGGLIDAIGGLVGFSSSSTSSRVTTASRSPSRRRPSPSTPRRRGRTASSPRSVFSQTQRSPRGKGKERDSPRSSPSPTRSRAKSSKSGGAVVPELSAVVVPPLDVTEYGGTGVPINAAPVWYYNVHRLPPYSWNYADGYLFPNMMLLSWVAPTGGRVVVKLDLLSCVEIRTSRAQGASEFTVEREGESHRLQTFELGYGDSIERLGCETRVEMLDWFNSIQTVFNGIISMTESERANGRPASPAVTLSSFDFSESVISSQLQSGPASVSQSHSGRRSRDQRPRTPTVPLTEGVLRSETPPIDATVNLWRARALERSSVSSEVSSVVDDPISSIVEEPPVATATHSPNNQSQSSRSYVPSSGSQTMSQTLSSGTLYAGGRTVLEIGSSTGTDIVASTLSFRGTASASLMGDSCVMTSSETASTILDSHNHHNPRVAGNTVVELSSASRYQAGVVEPRVNPAPAPAPLPQGPSNKAEDLFQGRNSNAPQEGLLDSPATQASDSEYHTASSPSASFVSLSGISDFPEDDDEEEEVVGQLFFPESAQENSASNIARLPTPVLVSEVDVQTVNAEDDTSTIAPVKFDTIRDRPKDSDISTPVVPLRDLDTAIVEASQSVEVSGQPEVTVPSAVLRVDAATQADVEEPPEKNTPQPTQVPLPNLADTVYSPAVRSVGVSPMALEEPLQPELILSSPQSDVLSTLSAAIPTLSQLPRASNKTIVEQITEIPIGPLALTPVPSLTSDGMSDPVQTPGRSPSLVESMWPNETDRSYDSSVLNASPSLRSIARTAVDYIGAIQSSVTSDIQTPITFVKTQIGAAPGTNHEGAVTSASSDADSADNASTPTASSWLSSLPLPSVPSNTMNETGSLSHMCSEVQSAKSLELGSSIYAQSVIDYAFVQSKVFVDEGCQVDFNIDNALVSPRLFPLPVSRPPSRHSVSISASPETLDNSSSMDADAHSDIFFDRFSGLEDRLSSAYSQGSDKILDHLFGLGQSLNNDHSELRNMLAEILETTRSRDALTGLAHVEQGAQAKTVIYDVPIASHKVDFATSPILVAMAASSPSQPPVLKKEQATSPILMAKYRDTRMEPIRRQTINSILLTPPPRDTVSPDTLLETMSYLSSHHSDDISEMDLELGHDPLQVERVSPSWASDSSSATADSEALSESGFTEPQEAEEMFMRSASRSPSQLTSASLDREDGYVLQSDHLSRHANDLPREEELEVSSIAAGPLLNLPITDTAQLETASTAHTDQCDDAATIQMPIPTRTGLPLAGQLASLMAPEQTHIDRSISAGLSDVVYLHQADSPAQGLDEPTEVSAPKVTLVDRAVDSHAPEMLEKLVDAIPDDATDPALHEDKTTDTSDLADEPESQSHGLTKSFAREAEIQAVDITAPMESRIVKQSVVEHPVSSPGSVLPAFLQDQPTFSAHIRDIVTAGLSPALENVALLVHENRMVRDEFKKAHEDTVLRVHEMYRMAHDEMINSLTQIKALVSQVLASQTPLPGAVSMPQPQVHSTPPGFVPYSDPSICEPPCTSEVFPAVTPSRPVASQYPVVPMPSAFQQSFEQPMLFPTPHMGPYTQPYVQQPVFVPVPSGTLGVSAPPPLFVAAREAPVIPSPPFMSSELSASSTTISSAVTPTFANVAMPVMPHAFAPTAFQESMIPLPPSPPFMSPQFVTLPLSTVSSAVTTTHDLPVVPEMISREAGFIVNPASAGAVHASEYAPASRHVTSLEPSEVTPLHADDIVGAQRATIADAVPEVDCEEESATDVITDPMTVADNILPVTDTQNVSHETEDALEEEYAQTEATPEPKADMATLEAQPVPQVTVAGNILPVTDTQNVSHETEDALKGEYAQTEATPEPKAALATLEAQPVPQISRDLLTTPEIPKSHAVLMEQEDIDSETEAVQSDMSGLTTPSRPSTPADTAMLHDNSPARALHSHSTEPSDRDVSFVEAPASEHILADSSLSVPETKFESYRHTPAHDIEASIASAAADLRSVVDAARSATEGALAASKQAQTMLESVRAQREDLTLQLDHCTREREAAKVDRDEALALRERVLTEAASERERDVADRDDRIAELQQELDAIKAREMEQETTHVNAILERDAQVQALQAELEKEKELRDVERAERSVRDAERDSRIAAMEEELVSLRAARDEDASALAEATSEREREVGEREMRIQSLQQELESLRLEHDETKAEREKAIAEAAERDARIQSLDVELTTLRDEISREHDEHLAAVANLEELQQVSHNAHAEALVEHQRLAEERDQRIAALEEEVTQARADHEADILRRVNQAEELAVALAEKESALSAASAERDNRILALEEQLAQVTAEHEQKQQQRDLHDTERHAAWDERERALQEAAAEYDVRVNALEEELASLRGEREQEKQQLATEEAKRVQQERDLAEAALERERLSSERHDTRIKELTDELAALRIEREQERQQQAAEEAFKREAVRVEVREIADTQNLKLSGIQEKLDELTEHSVARFSTVDSKLDKIVQESGEGFTNVDSRLEKLVEASTEQLQSVETRFTTVEQISSERFASVDTQLEKMAESSNEKHVALEAQLAKIDQDAIQAREQHEAEIAEAAAKPTVESLFEEHMGVLKVQVQQQIDALENDLKADGSRQHEDIIANVRATIEEQSTLLVTTCLDELGKLLESIGAQQQAELLSAMRVSIQEQVTFNISYYLEELTKMFDTHGVRQLSETIEAVRATAREQIPYNTEEHLTDFCKNLAPEMLQLFQEIKEKAEEKTRLDRQIDILRRHKHDYEAGELRDDDFAEPPPIHVSRSDADLHKAWRGRSRPNQTGSHRPVYPEQWTQDVFDRIPAGEVALLPHAHDAPLMPSHSPNASFYRG